MALTITPLNFAQLSACDALTDADGTWSGNSAGTEGDFFKEGIGCLGFTIRTVGNNDILYTKASGTWDLSGIKHLRIWFLCSTLNAINVDDPADPANAGIQFFVGDATYTAYYKVSGKTSYPGGWYNLVVDLSRAADSGTKPTGMLCTKIGIRMNMTTAPKNVDNVWIDNLILCDGLSCDSDTQFGFQEIYDKDNATTGAWGVIRKIGGVYYLTGKIQIGVGSGSTPVDFKDTSQAVIFEDRKVNSALYGINAVGNSNTTKLQLGDKPGDAGISGCVIRTQNLAQTPKFTIGASSLGVNDVFKLYGSNFLDAGIVTLPPNTANREVLNCNFERCGEVLPNTCVVKYCNFISADDRALRISSISHNVTDSNFISCPKAVHIPAAGTYGFNALMFSSNTYDIENSSAGGAVYIDRTNASNPDPAKLLNSGAPLGTTTINPLSVYLTIYVEDEAGAAVVGASVAIYKASDMTQLMNELTVAWDSKARAQEAYSYTVDTPIIVRVRKSSTGTRYSPLSTTGTITSSGFTLTAVLTEDLALV